MNANKRYVVTYLSQVIEAPSAEEAFEQNNTDSGSWEVSEVIGESALDHIDYEKCAICHLFVERNTAYRPGAGIAEYVHLARGDDADEELDASHEPRPSGMRATLLTWKAFGPVEMRQRFTGQDADSDLDPLQLAITDALEDRGVERQASMEYFTDYYDASWDYLGRMLDTFERFITMGGHDV